MKNLIVFYSLEGNTKLIAEILAQKINADILELKAKKEYPNSGFKKYFVGGASVKRKEKREIIPYDVDMNNYDNIFIGTPIWANTYVPVYNTFLDKEDIRNKSIYLFACHKGGGAKKFYSNIKSDIPNNTFKGEIDFIEPIKSNKDEITQSIDDWLKKNTLLINL